MNKKSVLGRMQLPIDVTALLDVVFIVLLIVICHQQRLAVSQEAERAEAVVSAEEKLAEAEAARSLYAERMETAANLSDYVSILTVYVDYTPGNPSERHIRLLDDAADAEILSIPLNPSSQEEAYHTLTEEMHTRLDAADGKPVILSLDLEHILYRDEEAVNNLFSSMQADYDNLYFK
ncbi:MAG: hypothetical protein K6G16_08020 [Lachnospiraceae bacterium]|nr:hypothetical protein [Lachnospiraceae bacterium]